jgi:steroid delta-isomerase
MKARRELTLFLGLLAATPAGAKPMPDPAKMEAAVHAYVAAFEAGSADQVAALYAQDATVEDPIGSPLHKGREAIRAFYAESMKTGAKLKLEGPVRVGADYAVFPFSVNLNYDGGHKRIDVIDTFRFNEANEVVEMRAFWGPNNMHGF